MSEIKEVSLNAVQAVDLNNLVQVTATYKATIEKVSIDGVETYIKTLQGTDPFGRPVQTKSTSKPYMFFPETMNIDGKDIKVFRCAWEGAPVETVDPVTGEPIIKNWCNGFDIICENKDEEDDVIRKMTNDGYYLVKSSTEGRYNQAPGCMKFNPAKRRNATASAGDTTSKRF